MIYKLLQYSNLTVWQQCNTLNASSCICNIYLDIYIMAYMFHARFLHLHSYVSGVIIHSQLTLFDCQSSGPEAHICHSHPLTQLWCLLSTATTTHCYSLAYSYHYCYYCSFFHTTRPYYCCSPSMLASRLPNWADWTASFAIQSAWLAAYPNSTTSPAIGATFHAGSSLSSKSNTG